MVLTGTVDPYVVITGLLVYLLMIILSIPSIIFIVKNSLKLMNSEDKFNIKRKRIRHINIVLYIFIICNSFNAVGIHSALTLISMFLLLAVMIVLSIQQSKFKEKHAFKLFLLIFTFGYSLIELSKNDPTDSSDPLSVVGAFLLMISVILLIVEIIDLITFKNKEVPFDSNIKKSSFTYPIGFVNIYQFIGYLLIIAVAVLVLIIPVIKNDKSLEIMDIVLWFLLFFVALMTYLIIIQSHINTRPVRKLYRTLDFETFKKEMDHMLNNPHLAAEYRNFLIMGFAVNALPYDKELFYHLKQQLFVPSNKVYRVTYDTMNINILQTEEEYQTEMQNVRFKYSTNKKYQNAFTAFDQKMMIYFKGELSNKSLDELLPENSKNLNSIMMNKFYKAIYYSYHNQEIFMKLKEEFINEFPNALTLIELLERKVSN